MRYLAGGLLVLNFVVYGFFIHYIQSETARLDFIQSKMIPFIAEKSFKTGCMKEPSQAEECEKKAKKYREELVKLLGL